MARRIALRLCAAEHLAIDRYRRRRRGRRARGMVSGQDADRLRQRSARAVPWPRRVDLLVQRRVCRAALRGVSRRRTGHACSAYFSARPSQRIARTGDDRRHGQPGGRHFYQHRRTHFHNDIFSVSRRRQTRRAHPRHLRRRIRQGAGVGERPSAHGRADAGADAFRRGGSVRLGVLRLGRVWRRFHRQPVFMSVQLEPRAASRADSRRRDVPLGRHRFSRLDQRRLSPNRRDRGRRRQSARARHRRLVQAVLPDVAVLAAGSFGRNLSGKKNREPSRPPTRAARNSTGRIRRPSAWPRGSTTSDRQCGSEPSRPWPNAANPPFPLWPSA